MRYVYLIKSESAPNRRYVGVTANPRKRLADHNAAKLLHTSKHAPWHLVPCIAISIEQIATVFERYLKAASGQGFAERRSSRISAKKESWFPDT